MSGRVEKTVSEHRDSAVGALQTLVERLVRMDFILPKDLELLNAKLHMEVAVRTIEEWEKAVVSRQGSGVS